MYVGELCDTLVNSIHVSETFLFSFYSVKRAEPCFRNTDIESSSDNDSSVWESLLDSTLAKALDHGLDGAVVLEDIASSLIDNHDWDMTCTPLLVRATDALLSHLELDDLREAPPLSLLRLVNDVLGATYPPSPSVKQYARWVLRTISDLVRKCDDKEMMRATVAAVKESVSVWILDEVQVMDEDEWVYDVRHIGQKRTQVIGLSIVLSRWSHCTAISCLH